MPVNAVSPSSGAVTQAVQQRKPQETQVQTQAQKPDQSKSVDESAKARQAQQEQAQKSEPPKPVVNAKGQKTGQVISVTA
jgi:hypothetical protein